MLSSPAENAYNCNRLRSVHPSWRLVEKTLIASRDTAVAQSCFFHIYVNARGPVSLPTIVCIILLTSAGFKTHTNALDMPRPRRENDAFQRTAKCRYL